MGGKPCIRKMRVTVGTSRRLIELEEEEEVSSPYLEREDILEALSYAAWRAEELQ